LATRSGMFRPVSLPFAAPVIGLTVATALSYFSFITQHIRPYELFLLSSKSSPAGSDMYIPPGRRFKV